MAGEWGVTGQNPASVGELLEQAQRQAWDLTVNLPPPGEVDRVRTAADRVRAHLGAWPGLIESAGHLLRSIPLPDRDRRAMAQLTVAVERLGQTVPPRRSQKVHPDERMTRIASLLAAAGDLLTDSVPQGDSGARQDALAVRDKVAVVLRTAATTTTAYIEMAPNTARPGGLWDSRLHDLAHEARQITASIVAERAGRYDDVATSAALSVFDGVDGGEGLDRYAVFTGWKTATERAVTGRFARGVDMVGTTSDLVVVTRLAALTFRAGAEAGLVDTGVANRADIAARRASAALTQTLRALRDVATGPGGDLERHDASRQFRDILAELYRDPRHPERSCTPSDLAARDDMPQLLADIRLLLRSGQDLARALHTCATGTAHRQEFLVPARVAASTLRPVPTEWLEASRHGHWLRAPASLPQVARVVADAARGNELMAEAALAAAGTSRAHRPGPGTVGFAAGVGRMPEPYQGTGPAPGSSRDRGVRHHP